ncbi:hypothetical protein AKJ51_03985 [candidate division MSBL1 archaeon SCGC-AAA382A20]|uniref:Uroporphyrinogen decarboxylase (URO-D) domain-containing protein n=1 Tax=candidate division MSBL1 archaeon SCGC-AAA382A20 TaxID=1698280 RepID=A0A133VIG1_9EURY|nr:hypothetical protein AKJ51_03985 [candidate division MSBL1 archaeon SCGC-AAA382A20]
MSNEITPKERLFTHFEGEEVDRPPVFSALGSYVYAGCEKYGYPFYSIFKDSDKASDVLATPIELYDFESALCPIDLNIVAEAFGAEASFYPNKPPDKVMYPTIKTKLTSEPEEYGSIEAPELTEAGRIPYVVDTLKKLKEKVDPEIPVGAFLIGPFLAMGQMVELDVLYKATVKYPEEVKSFLDTVTGFQIEYAKWLEEAGADFISLRPMGSSQDTLGVRKYKEFAQPYIQKILDSLEGYKVLHICGQTDDMVDLMWESGAHGISLDQKNDYVSNREELGPEANIYEGIDPYETMVKASPEEIESMVKECFEDGIDVPMTGCDLWPEAPVENMQAFSDSIKKYGKELWIKKKGG